MARRRAAKRTHDLISTISEGLPTCQGPKLQPFRSKLPSQRKPAIEFLETISTAGGTANVIKAKVDEKVYALKVFRRFRISPGWGMSESGIAGKVDEETLTSYVHPFFAECRAYGRLQEVRKEHLAARCYGYIMLGASQQKALETKLGPFEWNDKEGDLEGGPLRVIVKEFVPGKVDFHRNQIRKMFSNMRELHRCGIFVVDVKSDMYVNGAIVDFSHAQTLPHIFLDTEYGFDPYEQGQERVYDDLSSLGEIFQNWNRNERNKPKIPKRMEQLAPNGARLATLRKKGPVWDIKNARMYDATRINWQKRYPHQGRAVVTARTLRAELRRRRVTTPEDYYFDAETNTDSRSSMDPHPTEIPVTQQRNSSDASGT